LQPKEVVNCKKTPLDASELESVLGRFERVLVTKGKKILDLDPDGDREEILKTAIGRSGNLRAPAISKGKTLIVGFSEEAYQHLR
jgi:arsenate reductase-like glutaredoxin family protein